MAYDKPASWKDHCWALVMCAIGGALVGPIVGFVTDLTNGQPYDVWLDKNPGAVKFWVAAGAIAVITGYLWKSFFQKG